MKITLTINGREHTLEFDAAVGHFPSVSSGPSAFFLDGAPFDADVAAIRPGVYSVIIGGRSFETQVAPQSGTSIEAGEYSVYLGNASVSVTVRDPRRSRRGGRAGLAHEGRQNIAALMPGKVVRVLVNEGDAVETGQGLIVIEAMKMQNEIKCRTAGTVQKIAVREGQPVNPGDVLLMIE